MKKPAIYIQPSRSTVTTWDFEGVTAAVGQHELGNLTRSAYLADNLQRDDRIHADTRTLVRHFCRLPLNITPAAGTTSPTAKLAADMLREVFPLMIPTGVLPSIVRDIALLGVSFGQQLWSLIKIGGRAQWLNVFEPWHASTATWFEYDHNWRLSTMAGQVVLPMTPNEDAPSFAALRAETSHPFNVGLVRALGHLMLWRQWSSRDWARLSERHGLPILTFSEPPFLDAEAKKAFYGRVQSMGSEAVMRLPRNAAGDKMEMALIEPSSTPTTAFEAWRHTLDNGISILIRGSNLPTETRGASLAAAQTQNDINDLILDGLATAIAATIIEQLVKPWGRLNVPGWSDAVCPTLTWKAERTMSATDVVALSAGNILTIDESRGLLGFPPMAANTKKALASLASGAADLSGAVDAGGRDVLRILRHNADPRREAGALFVAEVARRSARGVR